jgi:transmembrane protein EpsG
VVFGGSSLEYIISILIYSVAFMLSIVSAAIYQEQYRKKGFKDLNFTLKSFWILAIISVPVFISTIRYGVGTDYYNYLEIYTQINSLPTEKIWVIYGNEPLFFYLNKLAYIVFNSSVGLFFLTSFIVHLFIILGLDYYKKHISLPLALFIFYMILFNFGLNGMRSAIAISIVFFSLRYIHIKKPIHFFTWIIIATLFHNTAIICSVFYLLKSTKNEKRSQVKKILFYTGIVFTPIVLVQLLNFFENFFLFSNYSHYILNTNLVVSFGFLISVLPILIPIVLFRKRILKYNNEFEYLINLSLLNIPFQYIGYYVEWGGRLVLYTNSIYLIIVPLLIRSIKIREDKLIIAIYFICYFLYYYISHFVIGNSSEGFPYKSLFRE